jgi:hypothetical protein
MWWMPNEHPWAEGVGAWTDAAPRAYVNGEYNGVYYQFERAVRHTNLNFLRVLPHLRYVEINGRVTDDTAVFGLPNLEELILLTRCRRPIPEIRAPLKRLAFDDRPGKERLATLSALQGLVVWGWRGQDLQFAAPIGSLEKIKLEATNQLISLNGLQSCRNLAELEILDARAISLVPLRELTHLRVLRLIGSPDIDQEVVLDLSDIAGVAELEDVTITYAGAVKSLKPLLEMPRLREVRLRQTLVLDDDLSPLDRLPEGTTVVGPSD